MTLIILYMFPECIADCSFSNVKTIDYGYYSTRSVYGVNSAKHDTINDLVPDALVDMGASGLREPPTTEEDIEARRAELYAQQEAARRAAEENPNQPPGLVRQMAGVVRGNGN